MEPHPTVSRILVVDDDPKIRSFLRRGLVETGWHCETAPDGETALEMLRAQPYDLALLDIMLPGLQGWEVMETVRAEGMSLPVIWVTARDALDERIRGLQMGGDDYVVKPFAFEELLARMTAVLRRHRLAVPVVLGDLKIDVAEGKVSRADVPLDLTRTEYGLLRKLVEHHGQVVGRDTLLESVWGIEFDPGTNMVDVHIRRLRKKLDEPFERPLIHTVRGAGYVIEDRS